MQDIPWADHLDKYKLILGWWCLSYLSESDALDTLKGALESLKEGGYMIFSEPVGPWSYNRYRGQSTAIRPGEFYTRLFQSLQITIVYMEHYAAYHTPDGYGLTALDVYLLRYGERPEKVQ